MADDKCLWKPCKLPLIQHSNAKAYWHGFMSGWNVIQLAIDFWKGRTSNGK